MDCREAEKLLRISPEDRSTEEQKKLEDHIRSCEACREEELLQRMDALVSSSLRMTGDEAETNRVRFIPVDDPVSEQRRTVHWAAAASIFFVLLSGTLGFMLGQARSEVKHLSSRLEQARKGRSALERSVQEKEERIQALEKQKGSGAPRTVNYYIFDRMDTEQPDIRQAVFSPGSVPEDIQKLLKGNGNENNYY